MIISESHRIRPAGRHLLTIGRDLIQDSYAAVVELVKNSYDADSPDVNISFKVSPDKSSYTIVILDHGHGMPRDTVINKWLVPSTPDKLERKISPSGRIMQGRKGVGRYAASVLGSDLLLETIDSKGERTTLFVEWNSFDNAEYLDDVEVLVETKQVNLPSGTTLTITGGGDFLKEWNQKEFEKLKFELKKLISPVRKSLGEHSDSQDFLINLAIENFEGIPNTDETMDSFPIFDLYDYRISGKINSTGTGVLTYSIKKARNTTVEEIPISLGSATACGNLEFDIRVYDRDADSIDSLIRRGLTNESGQYVGKLAARKLLNEFNGIGVYRNGFRIRPLGDAEFDWLKLNQQRVQNPSQKIGSNQVIGYVLIESEEQSNLIEKSARDGLRENNSYDKLKKITNKVISELEVRRFNYRRKIGLSKPSIKLENELEKLVSFESLKKQIQLELTRSGMATHEMGGVIDIINRQEEEKSKAAEEIRQAVATYQGQATLGKIINVVLHEGRRPLNYFRNEVPRINRFSEKLIQTNDIKYILEIKKISDDVEKNSIVLSDLFKRLDPLATGKRPPKKELKIKDEINSSVSIFREELLSNNIEVKISCNELARILGWSQDIHAIFTNLIDNSIFWMNECNSENREIKIHVESQNENIEYIDFCDTGPGIEPTLITDNVIFEPQFSTKTGGSGIGLAIAGDAAERNGLILQALESKKGAYFRLQVKEKNDE